MGVSTTITTSSGCERNQRHLSGTTASITTSSTANATHIAQFKAPAIDRHGSPALDCSTAITGMTSSAATSMGSSKRRAIRRLRSFMRVSSTPARRFRFSG